MNRLLLLVILLFTGYFSGAQLLTWTPPFPKEADAAQVLVITADATKGNAGLLNHAASDVYVHIGVITNFSTSQYNWKYVRNFGTPDAQVFNTAIPQLKATSLGNNKWSYTITGSLRAFFGITDANEHIRYIAVLFRSGNGAKKLANSDNSDMYIPIYDNSLAVRIDMPPSQPLYVPALEQQSWSNNSMVSVTAYSNMAADLKFYYNGVETVWGAGISSLSTTVTLSGAGNHQVVIEARVGATVAYDTINLFVVPDASPVAPLPAGVQDGINYDPANNAVTLVLRAPGKNYVTVAGDFNNWTPGAAHIMNKTPDGKFFWLRIGSLTPGVEYGYQYHVDGTIKVADPYAEKILNQNDDNFITQATYPNLKPYPAGQTGPVSVFQLGAPAYNWATTSFSGVDRRNLVIYELLVRDFINNHDWKTLKDSMAYFRRLGINAIEVMPFNEFEGNISWGYNSSFYFAPDKYYGTKNGLKEFIDSAHKNGIAVIMDIVLNHSYGPSPLARLYWDAQNNRPAAGNPWYNPVQPHAFGFGDDFNHESPDTKYFFNRVLQHWLQEYRIDGFRFDFSKGLTQRASTNDGNFSAYDATRIAIINGYAATARAVDPDVYLILEHFADNQEERELSNNGMMLWANVWTQYQEASMGHLANSNFSNGIYSSRGWANPHLVTFMESHDEERIVFKNTKSGNAAGSYNVKDLTTAIRRMELNAAFLLTIPGPKMIWQFGELGYDYSRCHLSTNGDGGDCNTKTDPKPIRWDYLLDPRRQQVFRVYSELNALRRHPLYTELFRTGTVTHDLAGGLKWLSVSSGDTSRIMVAGNFGVTPQTGIVTFPAGGNWFDYLNNSVYTVSGTAQNITLQPGEYRVWVNRNVNNVAVTPVSSVPYAGQSLGLSVYPNPAQGRLTARVDLPQSGHVTMELYNYAGQRVQTLHSAHLSRGSHAIDTGRLPAARGVYFIKLITKSATQTISLQIH